MSNIRLTVAYDGTHYLGWQKTPNGPTIEEALESALTTILRKRVALQAASRTDAGVHAAGQVVNFIVDETIDPLTLERWKGSLNGLLPRDIAVLAVELAPDDFHPTLQCTGKEYRYHLCTTPAQLPHLRLYSWHYPYQLDIAAMKRASRYFVGEKDFAAFCNEKKNCTYDNYVRRIDSIAIVESDAGRLRIDITGNHFLYKMVRNIVGTLVYVGCGKIDESDVPTIIESGDRTQAGITAPNHGLFLQKVMYDY